MILNPNCSSMVFRLDVITREEALENLKKIGIYEIEVYKKEYVENHWNDKSTMILLDLENPNAPNFKHNEDLYLSPSPNAESNINLIITYLENSFGLSRETGEFIDKFIEKVVKGWRPSFKSVFLLNERDRKIFHKKYKEFYKDRKVREFANECVKNNEYRDNIYQIFSYFYEYVIDDMPCYRNIDYSGRMQIMKDIAKELINSTEKNVLIKKIEILHPTLNIKNYKIFLGDSCERSQYPTMMKIDKHLSGWWSGYDGGGTAFYENYLDERKMREIAIKLHDEGLDFHDIFRKLKKMGEFEFYNLKEMMEVLDPLMERIKKGDDKQMIIDDIIDYQDEKGKKLRKKFINSLKNEFKRESRIIDGGG